MSEILSFWCVILSSASLSPESKTRLESRYVFIRVLSTFSRIIIIRSWNWDCVLIQSQVLREEDWDRDRIWRILFTAAERRANIVVDELRGKRTSHHQHVCILSHLIFLYVYYFEITDSRLIVLTDIISVCDTVTGALERRHLDGDIKFGDRHNAERGN